MALTQGSMVYATDADHIKTQEPVIHTVSKVLDPAVDFFILADATAGNLTFTLPAISAGNKSLSFFIKRIDTSSNWVKIITTGSDTIDLSSEMILGLPHEWLQPVSDGIDRWLRVNQRTFAVGSISYEGPGIDSTMSLTNIPQLFTVYDTNVFSTPGRLLADQVNNKIIVDSVYSPTFDGYELEFDLCFQFSNNVDIFIEAYVGGVASGKGACATGRGANNVFAGFSVVVPVTPAAPKDLEVYIWQGNAGPTTLDVLRANLTANKIGG